ncbi:MAG TPA: hypothetical protein VK034_28695 [Enhygromyxa sp.]|nr:hypothetical protein [Enhygromyxa sp.]
MLRRVCLGSILALTACKPTIIEDPDLEPRPQADPADDPLVEQEAVRVAIRQYAAALGRHDVEAAAASVVADTFGYYEDIRIAALRATREQLEGWDFVSVMMILQVRSKIGRAELEAVDGRRLFDVAVTEGLFGEDLDKVELDEIWIDEPGMIAQLRLQGQPIVWLRKIDGRWRIDIPEMVRQLGPGIEAQARERFAADGKARTAYSLLEIGSQEFLDIAILDGPLELEGETGNAP